MFFCPDCPLQIAKIYDILGALILNINIGEYKIMDSDGYPSTQREQLIQLGELIKSLRFQDKELQDKTDKIYSDLQEILNTNKRKKVKFQICLSIGLLLAELAGLIALIGMKIIDGSLLGYVIPPSIVALMVNFKLQYPTEKDMDLSIIDYINTKPKHNKLAPDHVETVTGVKELFDAADKVLATADKVGLDFGEVDILQSSDLLSKYMRYKSHKKHPPEIVEIPPAQDMGNLPQKDSDLIKLFNNVIFELSAKEHEIKCQQLADKRRKKSEVGKFTPKYVPSIQICERIEELQTTAVDIAIKLDLDLSKLAFNNLSPSSNCRLAIKYLNEARRREFEAKHQL